MDAYSEAKSMRLLTMYSRLLDGKSLKKRELAEEFGIAERPAGHGVPAHFLCGGNAGAGAAL